ncbi:MAG: glycosyltransferase family 4 protein [Methanosarcinaceae archaeon]
MKILIMDPMKLLDTDGSMIHRWELARNLANLGCEVHAVSYTDITPERVHIHPLPKKSKIGYIIQLLKLVMKHRFDIIYTRNVPRGVIGILIKKVWKSKLIFEVNGISLDERRLVEEQAITEGKGHRSVQIMFLGYLENFIIGKADAVIAVTQGIKDHLIDRGVDENKVWVIENGANTELFKPISDNNILKELKNRLCIDNDENTVTFVGNLAPWQGVEYLLRATPSIVEENPKTKFLIVGDGVMNDKLEDLSNKLNMGQNVIFTGTIPYEEVPQYINISDVCLVVKKKLRSGYSPLKLYEYMACEKPVIATNTEGFEVLEQSNAGILVNPEDPQELTNAVIKLLQNKRLREQMGMNGRKLVVAKYSWKHSAKKTIAVFEKVING